MRNEAIHAYSLHQRSFKDKQAIYYLLTLEHGIIHGVAKKGVPQFVPLNLFVSGKKPLKRLTQINTANHQSNILGQQQYAALYLNEITLKLLPVEDSVPTIYAKYAEVISQLHHKLGGDELKLVLRAYEYTLFNELGFSVDLEQDSDQNPINSESWYRFSTEKGWVADSEGGRYDNQPTSRSSNLVQLNPIIGRDIIGMRMGINLQTLKNWSLIHREMIDHLFDYQPLQSRILWQQFYRYQ